MNQDTTDSYRTAITWRPRDPLAIDLAGNGIETVGINPAAPILFDHNGDGIKTGTGWLQGADAWLVRDLNANGTIDSGLELFGVDTNITAGGVTRKATSGFEALSALNTNGDTVFDAQDTAFTQVRLWQDLNQDGISQAGELSTLAAKSIASIGLTPTTTSLPLGATGNSVTGQATVTRTGGLQSTVIDSVSIAGDSSANNLNLADNPFYREFPHDVAVTALAKGLPEMRGSGQVRDLREAMSLGSAQGTALATIVTQFKQATTRDAQMALIDQLIQKWGATSLMQTSASATTNASSIAAFATSQPDLYKKIIALEQLNGAMPTPVSDNASASRLIGALALSRRKANSRLSSIHPSVRALTAASNIATTSLRSRSGNATSACVRRSCSSVGRGLASISTVDRLTLSASASESKRTNEGSVAPRSKRLIVSGSVLTSSAKSDWVRFLTRRALRSACPSWTRSCCSKSVI